jgi:hypothetical protein
MKCPPLVVPVSTTPDLETVAAISHERWAGWTRYMLAKTSEHVTEKGETVALIPSWFVDRWKRQMDQPYADLSEGEKESDRVEARKFVALLTTPKVPE